MLRSTTRRFFSAEVFHDSQSGLTLTRVDPRSVRLHELSSLRASTANLPLLSRVRPSSCEIDLARARGPCAGVLLSARWSPEGSSVSSLVEAGVQEACVAVTPTAEHVRSVCAGMRAVTGARLRVRAEVADAWSLSPADIEDAVARLADAGASVITLVDGDAAGADEDAVRDAIERAMNLDVAGDVLMERLSVRSRHAETVATALDAGVTRLDTDATGRHAVRPSVIIELADARNRSVQPRFDESQLDAWVAAIA